MTELFKVRTTLQPWREIEVDAHGRAFYEQAGLLMPEAPAEAPAAQTATAPAGKPAPAQSPAAPAATTEPAKEG